MTCGWLLDYSRQEGHCTLNQSLGAELSPLSAFPCKLTLWPGERVPKDNRAVLAGNTAGFGLQGCIVSALARPFWARMHLRPQSRRFQICAHRWIQLRQEWFTLTLCCFCFTPFFHCHIIHKSHVWRQPKCLSTEERMKKTWHVHTVESYPPVQKNAHHDWVQKPVLEGAARSHLWEVSRMIKGRVAESRGMVARDRGGSLESSRSVGTKFQLAG